jgi:hypothetical protein
VNIFVDKFRSNKINKLIKVAIKKKLVDYCNNLFAKIVNKYEGNDEELLIDEI